MTSSSPEEFREGTLLSTWRRHEMTGEWSRVGWLVVGRVSEPSDGVVSDRLLLFSLSSSKNSKAFRNDVVAMLWKKYRIEVW